LKKKKKIKIDSYINKKMGSSSSSSPTQSPTPYPTYEGEVKNDNSSTEATLIMILIIFFCFILPIGSCIYCCFRNNNVIVNQPAPIVLQQIPQPQPRPQQAGETGEVNNV
jgi:hypothetical protein